MTAGRPPLRDLLFGRWSLSIFAWASLFVLSQAPLLVRTEALTGVTRPISLLPGVVSGLAFGLVLLLASLTYLRNRGRRPPAVIVVIATWFLAALVKVVSEWRVDVNILGYQGPLTWNWLLGGIVGSIATFGVVVYIKALHDYYAQLLHSVADSTSRLREVEARQRHEVADLNSMLARTVEAKVLPPLQALADDLAILDSDDADGVLDALAESAASQSRSLVRDVSHEISTPTTLGTPSATVPGALPRVSVVGKGLVLAPAWSLTFALALIAPPGLTVKGPAGLSQALITIGGWFVLFWLAWGVQRVIRLPAGWWSAGYVIVASGCAAVVSVALLNRGNVSVAGPPADIAPTSTVIVLFVVGVVGSWVARVFQLLEREARVLGEQQVALGAASEQLEAETARARRRVAMLLHGPVQGRLAAISLALRLFQDSNAPDMATRRKITIRRCRTLLAEILRDLEAIVTATPQRSRPLTERADRIRDRWAGMVDIEFDFHEVLHAATDLDDVDQERLFTAMEEGINNACSHGRARHVRIVVSMKAKGGLTLIVGDDGLGCPETISEGMGLRDVRLQGGRWSLTPGPVSGAVLSVQFPDMLEAGQAVPVEAMVSR